MMPLYFLSEISKYCLKFFEDSIDYGKIFKKFENNPWIRITVLNYTVFDTQATFGSA